VSDAGYRKDDALSPRTLALLCLPARRPQYPACVHTPQPRFGSSASLRRPASARMTTAAHPAAALAAVLCVALLAVSCAAHDTHAPAAAPRRLLQDAPAASATTTASSSSTDFSFVSRSRGLLGNADTVWRLG